MWSTTHCALATVGGSPVRQLARGESGQRSRVGDRCDGCLSRVGRLLLSTTVEALELEARVITER